MFFLFYFYYNNGLLQNSIRESVPQNKKKLQTGLPGFHYKTHPIASQK